MGHKISNSQPVEKADQGGRLRSVINTEWDQECKAYLSKKKKKIGGYFFDSASRSWLCSTIVYHIAHSTPLIHVLQATQFYNKCLMDMFSVFLVHTHFLLVFAFFLPGLPTSDPPAPLDPPLPSESRSCLSWLRCLRFPKKKNADRTAFNRVSKLPYSY